jgi:tRNA G18 (ribose-2'-O)-methylase SpoU
VSADEPGFQLIGDLDDPRLAMYRRLKASNATRDRNEFVVEGEKLFDRLLLSRFPIASVLASDRLAPSIAPRVPAGAPLYVVPEPRIAELVGYNFHRGVLACGVRTPWSPLASIARDSGPRAVLVVCPQVDNPENLGAIVRLADVFGAETVVASGRCPDPLSRRVLRVSMGTALRTPVVVEADLPGSLESLKRDHRFEAVAAVVDPSAEPLGRYAPSGRVALVFGSEGHGLDPDWLDRCDRRVTIPMRAGAESLNLAVAAGIVLHHVLAHAGDAGRAVVPDREETA